MPRMIPDKRSVTLALEEYLEERAIEKAEADRIRAEIESCYAAYEAAKDSDAQEIQEQIDTMWFYHELFQLDDDMEEMEDDTDADEVDDDMPTGPIKNMKAASRRKKTAAAKKRLGRKAKDASNNMLKRLDEDMKGGAIRGGRVVYGGKGGSIKADELMKPAKKMGFEV